MKPLLTLIVAVVFGISLSSCSWHQEKYAKNEKDAVAYLADKKTGSARTKIEGVWYAPEWGLVVLDQDSKGRVTGIFDEYTVEGVVSGRNAYLTLGDDGWEYFTVELDASNREKLTGFYSDHVPFSDEYKHEIKLLRIDD